MAQSAAPTSPKVAKPAAKKRRTWRGLGISLLFFIGVLVAIRLALPWGLRWYVNRVIDQNPLYDGKIGDVRVHLWRGAYTIHDIRIVKVTGNVPVPFYACKRMDLAIQWNALLNGKVVGTILMQQPELNFVDGGERSENQTGANGPWLKMIDDLFPFKINETLIKDGSIHFRAFDTKEPVDVYLSHLEASIENLSNIHNDVAPLIATVKAHGTAMDHAKFEYEMKLDPSSYRPTFELAVRLLGLDVTKTNSLARSYGAFDFERGWFDLVVELNAREGQLEGYVKPLFRNLRVFSLTRDVKEDDIFHVFWEALVGIATGVLRNQPRDQFGTLIPVRGDMTRMSTDILATVGNILRNAFIRAYLPRLQGAAPDIEGLEFSPGKISDAVSEADANKGARS